MAELESGVTLGQVQAIVDPVATKADQAMTAATSGLTSANRQQALRVQVTPDANGRVIFPYPQAYAAGIVPAV